MHISFIYVLFTAEFIALLLGTCIALGFYIYKKNLYKKETIENINPPTVSAIDIGSSYTDYIEQEIERNKEKISHLKTAQSTENMEPKEDTEENAIEGADERTRIKNNINYLNIRNTILTIEKNASEKSDDDIAFWETLYKGFGKTIKGLSTHEKEIIVNTATKKTEKVFYIETQGKKVDIEVNKLKDIIYEQENILNGIRKSLTNVKSNTADNDTQSDEELEQLMDQLEVFERQLNDSKICMDVLELENSRLQEELNNLEHNIDELKNSNNNTSAKSGPIINPEEMKEVLAKQAEQIKELTNTINSLKIPDQQAERIKATINDFARTSQEMMGCINILEEENERLQIEMSEAPVCTPPDTDTETEEKLQEKERLISELEESLIKKDVAYAKLQDEFSSIEKEYLTMYETLHGDNG